MLTIGYSANKLVGDWFVTRAHVIYCHKVSVRLDPVGYCIDMVVEILKLNVLHCSLCQAHPTCVDIFTCRVYKINISLAIFFVFTYSDQCISSKKTEYVLSSEYIFILTGLEYKKQMVLLCAVNQTAAVQQTSATSNAQPNSVVDVLQSLIQPTVCLHISCISVHIQQTTSSLCM